MGQSKVKRASVKNNYAKTAKDQFAQNFADKLKDFKTWAQVKSPKPLQPVLSYALDWLSPELLGTGFRMYEISDSEMKAIVPANKTNLDSQYEIHQGLVTNAVFELAKTFIHRQMPDSFFQMVGSEFNLIKKQKWSTDLNLHLQVDQYTLDDFFVQLQKNKKASIEVEVQIASSNAMSEKFKKQDIAVVKLHVDAIDLIA